MIGECLLSSKSNENELSLEEPFRPQPLSQYIGQRRVKQELQVYIEAARNREESLDHVLLYGPPGLGKTAVAMVIANEVTVNIRTTSGLAIECPGDLVAILNELEAGDVLFIGEIHRSPRVIEEMLYSAMEDFYIDIMVGQGPTAYPVYFPPPLPTLIGAATQVGMLSTPLRNRFGIISHVEYHDEQDLQETVLHPSNISQIKTIEERALETARRSRGISRIVNRLLKRACDSVQAQRDGKIDHPTADQALTLLQVDQAEPDYTDQRLLRTMTELYGDGSVGLSTLSVSMGGERETVEDVYEPYLIQKGFLKCTPRERITTAYAYEYFGYNYHIWFLLLDWRKTNE